MVINTLACIALLAMSFFLASASDPSPLQDFCVAVNDTKTTGMIFMFFLQSCSLDDQIYSLYLYINDFMAARPNAFMALQCLLMGKSARIQRLRQQMISSFQGFGFLEIPQTKLGQWSHRQMWLRYPDSTPLAFPQLVLIMPHMVSIPPTPTPVPQRY